MLKKLRFSRKNRAPTRLHYEWIGGVRVVASWLLL
jgi:hypothetical protein